MTYYKKLTLSIIVSSILFDISASATSITASGAIVDGQVNEFDGGNWTITSGAALTLGSTTTLSDGTGTVSLGHTISSTGIIGASGKSLLALYITADTTTLGGDVYALDIDVASGAILNTQTYDITTDLANAGTVTLGTDSDITGNLTNTGTGTVTFGTNSDISGTISNTVNGTVTLGSGSVVSGAITNDGTLNLHDTATSTISGTGIVESAQNHTTTSTIAASQLNITANTFILGNTINVTDTTVSNGAALNTQTYDITTDLANDGTVTLGTNSDITGDLTNNATGTVTLGSGSTISGTITNNGTLNLHDTATGAISGTGIVESAQTYTTTSTIAASQLNITANTFTLGDTINVTDTTVSSGATLNTQTNVITGNVANNGTLNLKTAAITGNISGTGTINVTENYTAGGTFGATTLNITNLKTVNLNAGAVAITGTTTINGTANIVSDEDISFNDLVIYDDGTYYSAGNTYTLVDMTSTNQLTVNTITGPNDTDLINFTTITVADAEALDKITVITEYTTATSIGITGNNAATYEAAGTAISSDSAIYNEMYTMNAEEINAAVETMNPSTEGVSAGVINVSNYSVNTVSDHLTVARASVNGNSGISTGDESLSSNLWVQGFYSDIRQNDKGGVSGYDADGYGFVLGIDKKISKYSLIYGLAFSAGKSEVKSKNTTTKAQTDTDTLQLTLYATKEFRNFYLEGMISYARNENSGSRHIVVGAIERDAQAQYDSNLYAARVGVGFPMKKNGFDIVPKASLNYINLDTQKYTETGAGSMNLTVDTENLSKATLKAGVNVSRPIVFNHGGTFIPMLRTGLTYEMGDTFNSSNSTFTAGGSSFETKGLDADDWSKDVGVGLYYISADKLKEFKIDYDLSHKSGYLEQIGLITAIYRF